MNLSSHPNISIVASGKFSGCDFVVVQGEHGLVIAHNYVNSKQDGNDPVAQLNELKSTLSKFGSITMKQFKTQGRSVHHGGGYVIGTKVEGTWKFHWIDVNLDGKIGTVANIQDEHWE